MEVCNPKSNPCAALFFSSHLYRSAVSTPAVHISARRCASPLISARTVLLLSSLSLGASLFPCCGTPGGRAARDLQPFAVVRHFAAVSDSPRIRHFSSVFGRPLSATRRESYLTKSGDY